MVIVKLIGGMGNQMFQYSTGRRLAYSLSVPLKLDLSWFSNIENIDTSRHYELQVFNIVESFASPDEVAKFKKFELKGLRGVIRKLLNQTTLYQPSSWVREKHYHLDLNILKLPDNVYLEGYWQSEKYFKDIQNLLLKEFTIKTVADEINRRIAGDVIDSESVSLHVRRGDYVLNTTTNNYHGTCSLDYYRQAAELISKQVWQPHFFIFSDDLAWVKNNLKLSYPVTFVDHNGPQNPHEDLRLMSLCKHHIIANSSFSWWGAWLCDHPGKIVLAPKKWFNRPGIDTSDLLPDSWIKI